MKKLSFIIATGFLTVLLSGLCCHGQQLTAKQIAYPGAVRTGKIEAALATLHPDTLNGNILALYSKPYKVRAGTIQTIVEKCAEFYQQKFPDVKFDLQIMILNREDWNKVHLVDYGSPYGMPTSFYSINKLFIAADKKAVNNLFGVNGSTDPKRLSQFDCIALHELGHIFLERYNHTFTHKLWADEFLASYFAICFFQQHKNYPGLPQIDESGYQPKYKTLEDFERLYSTVGPPNYGWYQGKFQELGKRLYPKFKVELLKKFIANYSPEGKKLPPLVLLKQLAPKIMNQWLKEMR